MKPETSPELQQIQEEFDISWTVGGIEAVKPILTRLAIEKAMLETYHYQFVRMEHDDDLLQLRTFADLIECMDVLNFADEVAEDYEHAVGRHALAVSMLEAKLKKLN